MIFIIRHLGTILVSGSTKRWDIFNSGFHDDGWSRRGWHWVSQCSSPLSRRRMVETPAKDTRYKSIKDYHTKLNCSHIAIESWNLSYSISQFSSIIIYRVFNFFGNSHFQTHQEFIAIDQRAERLTGIECQKLILSTIFFSFLCSVNGCFILANTSKYDSPPSAPPGDSTDRSAPDLFSYRVYQKFTPSETGLMRLPVLQRCDYRDAS